MPRWVRFVSVLDPTWESSDEELVEEAKGQAAR